MTRDWQHAIQKRVGANRYVALPGPVESAVVDDHPIDGPSVVWNYERNSGYAVLSERPLDEPSYVDVGRYSVYGADGGQSRIRAPDPLTDAMPGAFVEGTRVMYLAYESMTEAENATVYLLSTAQVLELLPDGSGPVAADGGDDVRRAILRKPGFLPAPSA